MNIAALVRHMDLKTGGAFDRRHYIMHDYYVMAKKYGFGLITVMTEEAIGVAVIPTISYSHAPSLVFASASLFCP